MPKSERPHPFFLFMCHSSGQRKTTAADVTPHPLGVGRMMAVVDVRSCHVSGAAQRSLCEHTPAAPHPCVCGVTYGPTVICQWNIKKPLMVDDITAVMFSLFYPDMLFLH